MITTIQRDFLPDTRKLEPGDYLGALAVVPSDTYLCELTDKERTMDLKPGDSRRPRFEVRTGIAIMGGRNERNPQTNPFHPNYQDNFCVGTGNTIEDALISLKADIEGISESLWH